MCTFDHKELACYASDFACSTGSFGNFVLSTSYLIDKGMPVTLKSQSLLHCTFVMCDCASQACTNGDTNIISNLDIPFAKFVLYMCVHQSEPHGYDLGIKTAGAITSSASSNERTYSYLHTVAISKQ